MILQSLYNYYQILLNDPEAEIAEPGYSAANVNFVLNLSAVGGLTDIIPLSTPYSNRKKAGELPYRRMIIPEQIKRSSGISPNFLCDNAAYVLGLSDKEAKDPHYAQKRFEAFRQLNIEILSKVSNEQARAVIAFLLQYDPQTALQRPLIERHFEGLMRGGNLIFYVDGENVLEDPQIRRAWEDFKFGQEAVIMQCLATGGVEPVSRLHPNIQGVRDAKSTGASLVSFNERAYESYNRYKGQGLNSPVSRRVASGYGVALNYLLSGQNPNRKLLLGDTTVVYWAESPDKRYSSAFAALINPAFVEDASEAQQSERAQAETLLRQTAEAVQKGRGLDIQAALEGLDEDTRFFVLGLAPNAARLAVRFFLTDPFVKFVERIMLHYQDLTIQKEFPNQTDYLSPFQILNECVSPKVSRREEELKSSWGLLGGSLMRSILSGSPYPEGLYAAIINRIRCDSDDEGKSRKITYPRAALIKAHLLRKYRRQAHNPYLEALQMSLNPTYNHPAYVLGRLFAVLEKAQREAIGEQVNATIKDRYFTSACAAPASVFPTLLRLSHHHTTKAEYGARLDRQIQDLLDLLPAEPFPARLSLDEQGIFILGYYHQRADFYVKKEDRINASSQAAS